jgi:C_GCAxxG_C_C family probable redox protein
MPVFCYYRGLIICYLLQEEKSILDIKKVEKKAREQFGEGNLFCAESVLLTIAEELQIVSPLIPRIATGFCSGFARTNGMCGAVSGAVMALGIVFGRDDEKQSHEMVYKKVQQFMRSFKKKYTATNCFDLTGCNFNTIAGQQRFYQKEIIDQCREYTGIAAGLAAKIINDGA